MKQRILCDVTGLFVVGLGTVFAVWALAPFDVLGNAAIVTMVATPVLLGAALYIWHATETGRKKGTADWMGLTLFTPLIGAVFFAIDVFVGSTTGSYSNFVQAACHAGGPFGIVITALICPVMTIVAAGSWMRSALLDRVVPRPDEAA